MVNIMRLSPQPIPHPRPSNIYVEQATISLVREYLYRKNFRASLKCLNHEESSFEGLHNQRLALVKELGLENLVLENKRRKTDAPLHSILEVLVKSFMCSNNIIKAGYKEIHTQTVAHNHQILSQGSFTEAGVQVDLIKPALVGSLLEKGDFSGIGKPYPTSGERLPKSTTAGPSKSPHSVRSPDNHPDPDTVVEPLSPPPGSRMNFETEFHIKTRPPCDHSHAKVGPSSHPEGVMAHSMLQSKRDTLAESWLTTKENKKRVLNEDTGASSSNPNNNPLPPPPPRLPSPSSVHKETEDSYTLEFEDIEDEDFGYSESSQSGVKELLFVRNPVVSRKGNQSSLDMKTWRELKLAVVGVTGMLQEGWIGQGFTFDSNIPYGLVQKKGGPCGVLAVVQSLILRNLIFGSNLCEHLKGSSRKLEEFLLKEPTTNCLKSRSVNQEWILSHRSDALAGTLIEVLWRCRKSKEAIVLLCLEGNQPGSPVIHIESLEELKDYVRANLYKFDCAGLVYSAVLTRGVDIVQEDMDFPNSPLLGQHGYCSQELINLLLIGKCISNAFDNEILLEEKALKGITAQSDIGLLSLFEHYGSFQVGSYLKNPKFPIWLICSESHFSVLFSTDINLVSNGQSNCVPRFTLFYYDGLARQEDSVRLTINVDESSQGKSSKTAQYVKKGFQNDDGNNEDNLIPPLEKCIRTKWNDAHVCWNGSEPIL